jgi:ABC-type dipeptide/oligopeptide/nickel transport system permease component
MGRIPASYLINRLFTLFLTVFIAATLIWIIPRLSAHRPGRRHAGPDGRGRRRDRER